MCDDVILVTLSLFNDNGNNIKSDREILQDANRPDVSPGEKHLLWKIENPSRTCIRGMTHEKASNEQDNTKQTNTKKTKKKKNNESYKRQALLVKKIS